MWYPLLKCMRVRVCVCYVCLCAVKTLLAHVRHRPRTPPDWRSQPTWTQHCRRRGRLRSRRSLTVPSTLRSLKWMATATSISTVASHEGGTGDTTLGVCEQAGQHRHARYRSTQHKCIIILETHSARAAMPTNAHPYVHTAHAHTRRCCHCVATFDGSKPSLAATPSIIAFKR